ncbi:DDB1- and CUL4-associated factor 8 [Tanacetum coccineum]
MKITSNKRQAKFIDETVIVTLGDTGQVNRYELLQDGRLAIDPSNRQVFYTYDEMGRFDLRDSFMEGQHLKSFNLNKMFGIGMLELKHIVFDTMSHSQFALAGSDQFARLYNVRKISSHDIIASCCPSHLVNSPRQRITSLAFLREKEILVSHYESSLASSLQMR